MRGIDRDSIYFDEFSGFTEKLRNRIRQVRKEKNLSQEQMENFELSLRQFQRIETGNTVNPTLSNIYKIAKAFGMTPSQLLDL